MAAAIPFAPMIIGAGAGALLDKGNPLRGAMLGAAGGGIAGPALSAATTGLSGAGAGIMAGSQAAGIPMGMEQAAMLGAQANGFGAAGVSHALGSAGVTSPMLAKGLGIATMGPQGLFGAMSGKDMALAGAKGLMQMGQQEPPPPMPQMPQQRPMMPPQQISRFMTSPLGRRM